MRPNDERRPAGGVVTSSKSPEHRDQLQRRTICAGECVPGARGDGVDRDAARSRLRCFARGAMPAGYAPIRVASW